MKYVYFFIFKFKKYENFLSRYLIYLFVIVQLTCFSISKTLHRSLHASLHATRTYRLRTHRSKIFSRHVDKPSKKEMRFKKYPIHISILYLYETR